MVIFDEGSFIISPLLYLFTHCSLLFMGSDDPTPSDNVRRLVVEHWYACAQHILLKNLVICKTEH